VCRKKRKISLLIKRERKSKIDLIIYRKRKYFY
jgi:hypothetical protein